MSFPLGRLSAVASIVREGVDPQRVAKGTRYVGLEHIASDGSFSDADNIDATELASTKFAFSDQHVLFGKLRPYLRKVVRPTFAGICSTDIIPIQPGPDLDRDYLFHFLRTDQVIDRATSMASGANLPRISPKHLIEFEIPLPPLDEQRRIAAFLDQADALRRKRREALAQLEALESSAFETICGDPISNTKNWPEGLELGAVADIVSGVTKGRKLEGKATMVVPYLAVANVQDRFLALKAVKEIEATEAEIARYRLQRGDLLLTEGGDPDKLGRGALWADELPEAIHQNHVFRVRLRSDVIDPLYLNWLVGSRRGKQYFLRAAKQTTGIASINMGQLKRFPLLTPPIEVQRVFAKAIEDIQRQRQSQQSHLAQLDALFASLQHRAFRGEL